MLRNRIVFSIFTLLLLLAGVYSGSGFFFTILLVMLFTILLGFTKNKLFLRKLSVSAEFPKTMQKGETKEVTLQLKNSSAAFFPVLKLSGTIINSFTGETAVISFRHALMTKDKTSFQFALTSAFSGTLALSELTVCSHDLFGITCVKQTLTPDVSTLVLPSVFTMTLHLDASRIPDINENSYSLRKPGDDPSECFDLRQYEDGDSMKQIHWKLSKRYDNLIVRRPSLPERLRLVLSFEPCFEEAKKAPTPELLDLMASYYASVACALLMEHISFYTAAPKYLIQSEEDFLSCLTEILRHSAKAAEEYEISSIPGHHIRITNAKNLPAANDQTILIPDSIPQELYL